MRLISEDVRSIRGALLFVYVIIEEEPFQAPPEPGASCQAGSCRRADRRLSIPNGRREIAAGIINICCVAVKLRAIHFIEGMREHAFRKRILERACNLPGRHTPERRPATCRPHHCVGRWLRRSRGHAGRSAGESCAERCVPCGSKPMIPLYENFAGKNIWGKTPKRGGKTRW